MGGAGFDVGTVGATDGITATGDVKLDSAGTVTQSQAISAAGLEVVGGGTFQLAGVNKAVTTLAVDVGSLEFKASGGFDVGTVGATDGITATGDVKLDSAGTVTQSQAISAAGLELVGGGTFQLASVDNTVTTLRAEVRRVGKKASSRCAVGHVDATVGMTATGDVKLDSAGMGRES